jgi:phosphatidylglycerophosphate synthase
MVCGILAGVCFASTTAAFHSGSGTIVRVLWIAAAVLMQGRLLANLFDGMVAIEQGRASAIGELYNEIPDRVSDAFILIGAGYALGSQIELGYLAAIMAVLTAYVRAVGKAITGQSEYIGPMAKQHRMAVLTLFCILSAVIPAQWWMAEITIINVAPLGIVLLVIITGSIYTSFRRLKRIAVLMAASYK